jgi:hypothetical protein
LAIKIFNYSFNALVDRLQGLEPLGHEDVGKLLVDGLHAVRHLEDPLFVGVGRVVIGGSAKRSERKIEI